MNVGKIDRTIMKALDMVEKLEKLFANNGAFENAVMEIDGDISYFGDVRKKLAQLYVDIEDLHMGAVGHNMDESVTESVKLTEGVLDGDDEDGFMARSQLYFLAKDAISLHGMISDRDNLEPWVQSKITTAANDMEAVRRYTEYNKSQADSQLPVPVEQPAEPEMDVEEGWETLPAVDADRYGERPGLEGPFQTRVGKVVYYDPKAGKYYDPASDHYLEYDEWRQLDMPDTPLRNEAEELDKGYRIHATSKDGEKMKSGIHSTAKAAQDMHYKMAKSGMYKKIEVVKESLEEEMSDSEMKKREDIVKGKKKKAAKDAKKVDEGMDFDDKRDGDLKQIAADMFAHAKKAAAKKVK
jgi:hypothetical protein